MQHIRYTHDSGFGTPRQTRFEINERLPGFMVIENELVLFGQEAKIPKPGEPLN